MGEINQMPPPPDRRPPVPPPVTRPEQPPPPERTEGTAGVSAPATERKQVDAPQAAPPARPEPDHFGKPEVPAPDRAVDAAKTPPGTIFVDAEVRKVDPTTGKLETTKQVHEEIPPKQSRESWMTDWVTEARKESMNARDDAETRADIEKHDRREAAWHDSAQHIGDGQAWDDGPAGATVGAIWGNWQFQGVDPSAGDYLAGARAVGQAVAGAYSRNQAARTDVPGKMNAAPDKPGATSPDNPRGGDQRGEGKAQSPGDGTSPEGRLNGAVWGPGGWMRDDSSNKQPWLQYERKVQSEIGEGAPGQSLYVGGKEFDTFYVDKAGEKVLVDAKYSFKGDFYDTSRFDPTKPPEQGKVHEMSDGQAAQMGRIRDMITAQVGVLGVAGATRVEWIVPDPELAKTLNATFAQLGVSGKISAKVLK